MSSRIVFEFCQRPDQAWERVRAFHAQSGARLLSEPVGDPPYLLVAVLPPDVAPTPFLERLRLLEGIGRADIDAPREAF